MLDSQMHVLIRLSHISALCALQQIMQSDTIQQRVCIVFLVCRWVAMLSHMCDVYWDGWHACPLVMHAQCATSVGHACLAHGWICLMD